MEVYLVLLITWPFVPLVWPSLVSGGSLSSFDQACTSCGGFLVLLMSLVSINTYILFLIYIYKMECSRLSLGLQG